MSIKSQVERMERRDKKLFKRKYGMRVSGKSVFLLMEVSHDQKDRKLRLEVRCFSIH